MYVGKMVIMNYLECDQCFHIMWLFENFWKIKQQTEKEALSVFKVIRW